MWSEFGPVYLGVWLRCGCGFGLVVKGCCVVDVGYQLLDVLFLLLEGRLAAWWVGGF